MSNKMRGPSSPFITGLATGLVKGQATASVSSGEICVSWLQSSGILISHRSHCSADFRCQRASSNQRLLSIFLRRLDSGYKFD